MPRVALTVVVLLLVVIIPTAATVIPVTPDIANDQSPPKQPCRSAIVFFSVPLPGHLNPLLQQALALARRPTDRQLIIVTADSAIEHVHTTLKNGGVHNGMIHVLSVGQCEGERAFPDIVERIVNGHAWMDGSQALFDWLRGMWLCMYSGGRAALQVYLRDNHNIRIDLMVIDAPSYAGFDVAEQMGVHYMGNNADLLYLLSPSVLPVADFTPPMLSEASIHEMESDMFALVQRVLMPVMRVVFRLLFALTTERPLNAMRADQGLKRISLYDRLRGKLVLNNVAFGLEYPRTTTPLVQLVGPMIPPSIQPLSPEDSAFISAAPGQRIDVVYVSMGTLAALTKRQVLATLGGLTQLVRKRSVSGAAIKVFWKLKKRSRKHLPAGITLDARIRITPWVSSQMALLAHPAVRVFVSHCGINSAHESVYFGTPLVCVPMFADQLDMSLRVVDAGVGLRLGKHTFSADDMQRVVLDVMHSNQNHYMENIRTLQRVMHTPNHGVEAAADWIEFEAEHARTLARRQRNNRVNSKHTAPPSPPTFSNRHVLAMADVDYPGYAASNLDVIAVVALLLCVVWFVTLWFCTCCCPCCGSHAAIAQKSVKVA